MTVQQLKNLNARIKAQREKEEVENESIQERDVLIQFAHEYRDVLPLEYIIDHSEN